MSHERTVEDRDTMIMKSLRTEKNPDGAQVEDDITGDYMAHECQQL